MLILYVSVCLPVCLDALGQFVSRCVDRFKHPLVCPYTHAPTDPFIHPYLDCMVLTPSIRSFIRQRVFVAIQLVTDAMSHGQCLWHQPSVRPLRTG